MIVTMTIRRLNRLARTPKIGFDDAVWLESQRVLHNLPPHSDKTISELQDVYAAKAVAERLKR